MFFSFLVLLNIKNLNSKTIEKSYEKVLERYKSAPDVGLAVEAFRLFASCSSPPTESSLSEKFRFCFVFTAASNALLASLIFSSASFAAFLSSSCFTFPFSYSQIQSDGTERQVVFISLVTVCD